MPEILAVTAPESPPPIQANDESLALVQAVPDCPPDELAERRYVAAIDQLLDDALEHRHVEQLTEALTWQLARIEISAFEKTFPHTVPARDDESAMRGFELFRSQCIRCHAINREGGRVGPDLNVPQNVTEYRPEPQIRGYIKNPQTFRYGNMPANPHLSEKDIDELVAYLRSMSRLKHDPDAGKSASH